MLQLKERSLYEDLISPATSDMKPVSVSKCGLLRCKKKVWTDV